MSVDPKNMAVHHGNADLVLSKKPVLVHWIVASNDSSSSRYADIHDGESTSAPKKLRIQINAKCCFAFGPPVPIYCSSGLYLNVEADSVRVTIGYEIVS